ncbi:hypothetical protein FW774_19125 [Pedobacter sp. BS3]|uniref:hypothetical protein n=1 Tax=Pedobacter sp. BS3 TaxID=2567937 RepID=UPI0011ECB66E|nr:hypothetical protein [Pedobacter sp. BS3]TZF81166.1 hypothetical protein FW774_19125 [Pedobacter sp. BS3]
MKKALLFALSLFLMEVLSASVSKADILGQWNFTSETTTATTSSGDVTNSSLIFSAGNVTYLSSPSSVYASGWPTSATFSSSSKYCEFSITTNSGKQMLLSSVTFDAGRTNAGPTALKVQYSQNGFSTSSEAGDFSNDNTSSLTTFTLTNLPTTAISGTITFRIWGYNASSSGGNFRINNITINGVTSTLPVTLTSFTAKKQGTTALLNWQTASEQDNAYFDILRSQDGSNFSSIARVTGKGTTTEYSTYTFTDFNPQNGLNYYRLKQVDQNGNEKILADAYADMGLTDEHLNVYADASQQKVNLFVYAHTEGPATVQITDISGHAIANASVALTKGYNTLTVPALLSKNIYIATLTGPGLHSSARFVSR